MGVPFIPFILFILSSESRALMAESREPRAAALRMFGGAKMVDVDGAREKCYLSAPQPTDDGRLHLRAM